MTLVTLLSTIAMLLGLGGIVPQLVRMVRARSAGGQAPLGYGMGLGAHVSMAYVNFFGFHSTLLAASNVLAAAGCTVAIALILTLRSEAPAEAPPADALDDLPTQEFAALRAAVLARDTRPRTCGGQPARRGPVHARSARGVAQPTHA